MLSRRNFGACAICAIAGFAATGVITEAEAQTPGFKRTILQKTELADTKYVTVLVSVEIDPGAVVARHTHPGIESAYLIEGEAELFVQGQPPRKVKAGDGFQIAPETPHSARNGDRASKVLVTYVVDKDKPLASPAPE
jgi:quercetin dioxygenase-like cupin family protein